MSGFSKQQQLYKHLPVYRNHEEIWQFLGLSVPTSKEESQAMRYGKCACPSCPHYGTIDRPLDLHHIVPRSHSKALINQYANHLYLCGDFFSKNHHKALHGEMTPGRQDWVAIGIFSVLPSDRMEAGPMAQPLIDLAIRDRIARTLLSQDPALFIDYARKQGIIEDGMDITEEDRRKLEEWAKMTQ